MACKTVHIIIIIVVVSNLAAGIGVLTWWLLQGDAEPYEVIELNGDGFGQHPYRAAFTRIREAGDLFWWFYPATGVQPDSKPIILWLDGVFGNSPSLLANFGMFGPYDINMNTRESSWIDSYNLLFVDAPLGTGFSSASNIPTHTTLEEQAEYLQFALDSFYSLNEAYNETSLYIFGQGQGAQLAGALAKRLHEVQHFSNLKGVVIGNGFISPAQTMTKLGFYLEELGYVDARGRDTIENLSQEVNILVEHEQYEEAYNLFSTLGSFINVEAGAVAVNMGHIVQKLTTQTTDVFGESSYLNYAFGDSNVTKIMNEEVAASLGISNPDFDGRREELNKVFADILMRPITHEVEYLLVNTTVNVTIYNGNLDAVSNTPGQLEWVNNLQWSGQEAFRSSGRQTFVVGGLVQGYFKETNRLAFYWINAAGVSVPLDSPQAMRRLVDRTVIG